jgi:hypothetical protein
MGDIRMEIERIMELLLRCASHHEDMILLPAKRFTFDEQEHEMLAKACMDARNLIARMSNGQPIPP